jgi:hypothetical protein
MRHDPSSLILCQRVWGSVGNTRVFLMETTFIADAPNTDPGPNISNHPGIGRLTKRYQADVSYPETWIAYSTLSRWIQLSISSLRNEVQAHLKGTMLSSAMISDLTLRTNSLQRPILTCCHLLSSYAPTPRHTSELFTLHHWKQIFFLLECFESLPASKRQESCFRHETVRCTRGSSHSA